MMVAIRTWMSLLFVPAVKFSKASESVIQGTSVENHAERMDFYTSSGSREKLMRDGIAQLDKLSRKPVQKPDSKHHDGDFATLKRKHSFIGSPKKRLRTSANEVVDDHKHYANLASNQRPLSEERKAEIKRNLARYQGDLTAMKSRGEPMRNWLNIIMEREEMLEKYSLVLGKESISSILRKLKIIQQEINTVVQINLRTWAGLGGTSFEPGEQQGIAQLQQELVHGLTDGRKRSFEEEIQPQTRSMMISSDSKAEADVDRDPGKEQRLKEAADVDRDPGKEQRLKKAADAADYTENPIGNQDESKTQLNEHHLKIIYEDVMDNSFQNLSNILHSVVFHSWNNSNWVRYMEEMRVIKLAFEKCILQTIQFMYKFKLINEGKFNDFMSSHQTLELIGNHLFDLFHVVKYQTYNELAFIPDLDILSSHWKTRHLDQIWKVIGKSQKSSILSKALVIKLEVCISFEIGQPSTEYSRFLDNIRAERFLQRLEYNTPGHLPQSYFMPFYMTDLREIVKKVIKRFQHAVPDLRVMKPMESYGKKELNNFHISYILIYNILNFTKTYHEEYLRSVVNTMNEVEYDILEKQVNLFSHGLKIHHMIQKWQTYREISLLQKKQICIFTKDNTVEEMNRFKGFYEALSRDYFKLESSFKEIIKIDANAERWFQSDYCISKSILNGFKLRATSWDMGIKEEIRRRGLLKHLHNVEKNTQEFPHLEYNHCTSPFGRDEFNSPGNEILDLLDLNEFYL